MPQLILETQNLSQLTQRDCQGQRIHRAHFNFSRLYRLEGYGWGKRLALFSPVQDHITVNSGPLILQNICHHHWDSRAKGRYNNQEVEKPGGGKSTVFKIRRIGSGNSAATARQVTLIPTLPPQSLHSFYQILFTRLSAQEQVCYCTGK